MDGPQEDDQYYDEDQGEDQGEDAGQPGIQYQPRPLAAGQELTTPRGGKGKKKSKKLQPIRINLSACKYEVLRIVQRKLGWREVGDDEEWEVYWTDTSVGIERIIKLNRVQKINHFNGMLEICRKKSMARNLSKMAKLFPGHYDFFPRTFLLPNDIQELMADVKARGKKQVYILKPDAGCQGRGIRLVQGGKEEAVLKVLKEMEQPNVVAQHYLTKPLLVNGFKFDMRIYALVLACDPLRVFIFHEGLARFCTEKYSKPKADNLHVAFMHLTNYAVNKHNENFIANQGQTDEDASKWTLQQLSDHLVSQGHDWQGIWSRIQQLIVKSLASIQPILKNNYRSVLPPDNDGFSCFEILGYDIMLDTQLQPWLIEVNHSPSFNIDSPLDLEIKEQLITDTINLVRIDPKLIAKAKKADKKAAAGRLLEPLQKKKPPGTCATFGPPQERDKSGAGATVSGAQSSAGPAGSATSGPGGVDDLGGVKPKTQEEYEAIRAEALRKREKYEAKHCGGFTRIYPTDDRTLQGLYDELLRGASELFQSTFQAKAKKNLEALEEERKKREETDTESVKEAKARARAYRDRLAQQALDRRTKKALEQLVSAVSSGIPGSNPLAGYVAGPNGMLYLVPGATAPVDAMGQQLVAGVPSQTQQRSEVWGESDAGYSPVSSRPGSRPISARSVHQRSAGGAGRLVASGLPTSGSSTARLLREVSAAAALVAVTPEGSQGGSMGANIYNQQGGLPPQPFRGNGRCDAAAGGRGSNTPTGSVGSAGTGSSGVGGSETLAASCSGSAGQAVNKSIGATLRGGMFSNALCARDLASWGSSGGGSTAKCSRTPPQTPNHPEKRQYSPFLEASAASPPGASSGRQQGTVLTPSSPAAAAAGGPTLPHARPRPRSPWDPDTDQLGWTIVYTAHPNPSSRLPLPLTTPVSTAAGQPFLARFASASATAIGLQPEASSARDEQGSGVTTALSRQASSPTFWRSASMNPSERCATPTNGWGVAGAPASVCIPTASPALAPCRSIQRPLSAHQQSFAERMAAMAVPVDSQIQSAPSGSRSSHTQPPTDTSLLLHPSVPRPCPFALPPAGGDLLLGNEPCSTIRTPVPPPSPATRASRESVAVQIQSHISMSRPCSLNPRSPSPATSIYISGPPPPAAPPPSTQPAPNSTTANTYGGTLQYAAEAGNSFWPVLGGGGGGPATTLSSSSSFVIRAVPVSNKGVTKGGSLYTSLRPAHGSGAKGGVGARQQGPGCGASKVLAVTGTKVVHTT